MCLAHCVRIINVGLKRSKNLDFEMGRQCETQVAQTVFSFPAQFNLQVFLFFHPTEKESLSVSPLHPGNELPPHTKQQQSHSRKHDTSTLPSQLFCLFYGCATVIQGPAVYFSHLNKRSFVQIHSHNESARNA